MFIVHELLGWRWRADENYVVPQALKIRLTSLISNNPMQKFHGRKIIKLLVVLQPNVK